MCTFSLQRIALRTKAWFSVITAQLAGNAISLIVPGGAAAGAAAQFRMLAVSGMDPTDAVGGLTAFSFLGIGGLLALPVFVLPAVLFGSPVSRGLVDAAIIGAIGFVLFVGLGAWVMAAEAPLLYAGRWAQSLRNRLVRKRTPITGLPERLLEQRNLIRAVLGQKWWQATLLSAGRLLFDYLCLLFSVRAVGAHPRPSLILLAYAVAGIIGLVPITPGGLGIVEASLSGCSSWPGSPVCRRCWPRWPTGWRPTGCPCCRGRSPTAPSSTGTAIPMPRRRCPPSRHRREDTAPECLSAGCAGGGVSGRGGSWVLSIRTSSGSAIVGLVATGRGGALMTRC